MKYKNALSQKGLQKENLAKKTQLKIDELESLQYRLDNEYLDEDKRDDLEESLELMDSELEKAILKFNPEVYQKRLESVASLNKKKEEGTVTKRQPKPKEVKYDEPASAKTKTISQVSKGIDSKIDELKKQVEINKEKFHPEPEVDELETEEIDDFEKTATVKPKKVSTGLILMGVGAFFLTWGAVNFFRGRK